MVKTRAGLLKEWEQYDEERKQTLASIEEQMMVYEYALDDRIWSTGYYQYEKEMSWKLGFYTKDLLATKNKDLIVNFLERPYLISGLNAYGSNIFNKRNDTGKTILHFAAKFGPAESVRFILDSTPDVNIQTICPLKETPLHVAIRYGHSDIVLMLLEAGASPNIRCYFYAGRENKKFIANALQFAEFYNEDDSVLHMLEFVGKEEK